MAPVQHVRFVCISDTYSMHDQVEIPEGDILIHAGNFTRMGKIEEVEKFNTWLGTLPHKFKIIIAGPNELTFDKELLQNKNALTKFEINMEELNSYFMDRKKTHLQECGANKELIDVVLRNKCWEMKSLITEGIYLEDFSVKLYNMMIYGSPWTPQQHHTKAFCVNQGAECFDKWQKIPSDTDILITHVPPFGHGDVSQSGEEQIGCVELFTTIQEKIRPKYHVFGNNYPGYGITTDETTKYVNATTCVEHYEDKNKPIVFNVPPFKS